MSFCSLRLQQCQRRTPRVLGQKHHGDPEKRGSVKQKCKEKFFSLLIHSDSKDPLVVSEMSKSDHNLLKRALTKGEQLL